MYLNWEILRSWPRKIKTELQFNPDQFWPIPSGRHSWPVEAVADKFANTERHFSSVIIEFENEIWKVSKVGYISV